MMKKKLCALGLAATMLLGMTACGGRKAAVPVQQVGMLTGAAAASDKYAGLVVSENTTSVYRDNNKAIKELFVSEGDTVAAGQKLFSYDVEQLQLELERQQLELERLNNEITTCNTRLTSLEAQLKKATDTTEKTNLNLQISSETANKNEANYNRNVKQKEITQTKAMLSNVTVTSPVDGRIRKINEEAYDASSAYITIQDTGSYRIKGTLNELSMAGGIMEGVAVNIISRMDPNVMWSGTVSTIDYEAGSQNNNNGGMYYGPVMEESTGSSTSYPFYVDLDNSDGLLLGQHVYIEVAGNGGKTGVWVPENYLFNIVETPLDGEAPTVEVQETDADEADMVLPDLSGAEGFIDGFEEPVMEEPAPNVKITASIWVASEDNRLEERVLTLGQHDSLDGTYEVLDGLSIIDYVADPSMAGCVEGAPVTYRNVTDFERPAETEPVFDDFGEGEYLDDPFAEGDVMIDEGFADDPFAMADGEVFDDMMVEGEE